jgi:hypothetical protein
VPDLKLQKFFGSFFQKEHFSLSVTFFLGVFVTGGFFQTSSRSAMPLGFTGEWRIGGNVPWSVSWTGEQHFELRMSDDFPGLVDLVQTERPGEGKPRFAALHVTRHRRAMAGQLCHVCGRPTLRGDRYIFPVESGNFVTMPDESMRYAGNVPPVHLSCARKASELCPHLSQSQAHPVPYPTEDSRLMHREDVVPGMEEVAKSLPGNLRIVFTCYRLYGPRFTRQVRRLRAAVGAK